MDIMELGAIGEMVGGVAVLATLIYLAVQITGSRQALKTQTHHNLLMAGQRSIELILANAELADIVTRGDDDPTALSPGEWQRYSGYVFMTINAWEYGYYLSRSRSVPAQLWEGGRTALRFCLAIGQERVPRYLRPCRAKVCPSFSANPRWDTWDTNTVR